MTILFGILGKKFSGKSLVASCFRKKFIPIIELDKEYNNIFQPGNNGHKILINYVGDLVIDNDGNIDMNKLSFLICKEPWIKELIDDILNSEISNIIGKYRSSFSIHNIELGGMESYPFVNKFDFTIYVDSLDKNRISRMKRFGLSDLVINKVLLNEKSYDNIMSRYIVNNNLSIIELENECDKLIEQINGDYIDG